MKTLIDKKVARDIREKISYEYRSKYGVKIVVRESSNPDTKYVATVYKRIEPIPLDGIDEEIAECAIERLSKNRDGIHVNVRCWDMSRPDEPPYSREAYVWVTTAESMEDIDRFTESIQELERWYKAKRGEIRREIEKG